MFHLGQLKFIEEKIKDFLFVEDRYRIFLLICIVGYIICWSLISLGQLLLINEPVFDLGLSLERLWTIFHMPMTVDYVTYNIFFDGIVFLFSPISLFNNYTILLILQTLFIGITSIFLYGIAKQYLKESKISFIIASSYLIYFPLAGVNFFSFHFQTFFISFFIAGYYFYVKEKYKLSLILFIISGLTRYPYMLFPLLFSLLALSDYHKNIRTFTNKVSTGKNRTLIFSILLLSVSVAFIVAGYFMTSAGSGLSADIHINPSGSFITNLTIKLETLILLFLPFIFIPLLSKRWFLFYVPFIALLFISNNIFYEYPVLFQFQYGTLIIPFLYLGLIDGFFTLRGLKCKFDRPKKRLKVSQKLHKILPTTVLILVVVFALVFEPYGPFNSLSQDNYRLGSNLSFNTTLYSQLTKIVKLIPENNTHVLFQNDLPEVLPRPSNASYGFLIAGYTDFTNVSDRMIHNNSFSLYLANGTIVNSKIDFVLAYLNSVTLYTGDPSMYTFLTALYGSGIYGIVAEDMGFVLLERGFTGPPTYFVPLKETFQILSQNIELPNLFPNYNVLLNSPQKGVYENMYDPISLAPGIYDINFTINAKNIPPNSMIAFGMVSPESHYLFYLNVSNGDAAYFKVSMIINLSTFNGFVNFELSLNDSNSVPTLELLQVTQV